MDKAKYRKALDAATGECERLIRERVELDQRIVRLKQTIAGLAGLCGNNSHSEPSVNRVLPLAPPFMRLTSAIRQVLAATSAPMRPPELRAELLNRGLSLAQYGNKLAGIHNTLSRLQRQGEVIELEAGWTLTDKGKLAFQMDSLEFMPVHVSEPHVQVETASMDKRSSPGNVGVSHRRSRKRSSYDGE
jgi:hypothetical protein